MFPFNRKSKKTIALVVYPGFSLLEMVAAQHIWLSATMMSEYETVVVGPSTRFIQSSTPLLFQPQKTYAEVPDPHILLVIGGGEAAVEAGRDEALLAYLRRAAAGAAIIGSFGTGALILGAAGLLTGRDATTDWSCAEQLQALGAHYVRRPWVQDDRIFTGAGTSSAVDLSLFLVARLRGQKAARQVQIMAEWDPNPPFGGIDWSETADVTPTTTPAAPENSRPIALVIYSGLTVFDLVGPLELMAALSRLRPEFQPVVVSEQLSPVSSDGGLTFLPNQTFAEVPAPHVLIVPGGGTPTLRAMSNPALRTYIKTADRTTRFTTSVCTGALLLATTGLLQGRPATTHWGYAGYLPRFGARYLQERWVQSDKIINSAGVSAGIDMTLHLIAQLTDEATARQVQRMVHYDPNPPFGGIDYTKLPTPFKILRTIMGVQAPFYTHKPKRMLAQGV